MDETVTVVLDDYPRAFCVVAQVVAGEAMDFVMTVRQKNDAVAAIAVVVEADEAGNEDDLVAAPSLPRVLEV